MARKEPMQNNSDAATQNSEQVAPTKSFAKTRKVLWFLSAGDSWKRQGAILGNRASFPLLRRVIGHELTQNRKTVLVADLSQQVLERSKIGHMIIMSVMTPALFWGLLTISKGLAAMIRFEVYFNPWLLTGIPLTIFAAAKLRTSYLSYKVITEDLRARSSFSGSQERSQS